MPPLSPYRRDLTYAYAAGLFPALEALRRAPERVRRVLVSPRLGEGEGAQALLSLCGRHGVRVEEADRLLRRISGKDNCFAAAVFDKKFERPDPGRSHLAFHRFDRGHAARPFPGGGERGPARRRLGQPRRLRRGHVPGFAAGQPPYRREGDAELLVV